MPILVFLSTRSNPMSHRFPPLTTPQGDFLGQRRPKRRRIRRGLVIVIFNEKRPPLGMGIVMTVMGRCNDDDFVVWLGTRGYFVGDCRIGFVAGVVVVVVCSSSGCCRRRRCCDGKRGEQT